MAARIGPTHHPQRNLLGPRLKRLRQARRIKAVAVCGELQRRGWDISPSVFSHLEAGDRLLSDVELLLLLDVLGLKLRDLE